MLERLLATAPGVISVGELRHLWNRGLLENQLCGCGQPFADCVFWTEVMKAAYGDSTRPDANRMVELKRQVDRVRKIPLQILPRVRSNVYQRYYQEYKTRLLSLYAAIADVGRADLIIDSSKDVSYGYLLASMHEIDLRLLVLGRDPRGVAFSWLRKKTRPEIHWRHVEMERKRPLRTALDFDLCYALYGLLTKFVANSVFLKYEDLISDPWTALNAIGDLASHPGIASTLVPADKGIWLGENHTVAGNPNRFQTGHVRLSMDNLWQSAIPSKPFWTVTIATLPFLLRHRYSLLPSLRRHRPHTSEKHDHAGEVGPGDDGE